MLCNTFWHNFQNKSHLQPSDGVKPTPRSPGFKYLNLAKRGISHLDEVELVDPLHLSTRLKKRLVQQIVLFCKICLVGFGGSWKPNREICHRVNSIWVFCACQIRSGEIAPKALHPLGQDLLILSLASNDLKYLPPKVFEGCGEGRFKGGGPGIESRLLKKRFFSPLLG